MLPLLRILALKNKMSKSKVHVRGATFKLEGAEELSKQFQNLGRDFPKRNIRRASNKGIKEPLKKAIANAPEGETGLLKKGIVKEEEKKIPRKKKKVVFQIQFDRRFNDDFRKDISPQGKGMYGGTRDTGYYPVSVEYGFKSGAPSGYTAGQYFVREAIENTQEHSIKVIIDDLNKSITQLMKKK